MKIKILWLYQRRKKQPEKKQSSQTQQVTPNKKDKETSFKKGDKKTDAKQ